jgi:hypothetical protein
MKREREDLRKQTEEQRGLKAKKTRGKGHDAVSEEGTIESSQW